MERKPWYEQWPMKLQREQYKVSQRFPLLEFHIIDGHATWHGPIYTNSQGVDYSVYIECPDDYPLSSPRVYPSSERIENSSTPRYEAHLMPDGSLCLYYPFFRSADVTVADVAAMALSWIVTFERFIETGRWEQVSIPPAKSSTDVTVITFGEANVSFSLHDDAELRDALQEIRREVDRLVADADLRLELTEQIEELENQTRNPSRRKAVIKTLVNALKTGLSMSADTAQVWSTWGPTILKLLDLKK